MVENTGPTVLEGDDSAIFGGAGRHPDAGEDGGANRSESARLERERRD